MTKNAEMRLIKLDAKWVTVLKDNKNIYFRAQEKTYR